MCHKLINCTSATLCNADINLIKYKVNKYQVLSIIKNYVRDHVLDEYVIECDLPNKSLQFASLLETRHMCVQSLCKETIQL